MNSLLRSLPLLMTSLLLSACSSLSWMWPGNWFGESELPPADLVELKPEIGIRTLWTASLGKGTAGQGVKLVPTMAGGRIFVADRYGKVGAFDARNGTPAWKVEQDLAVSAGPGVGEGLVLLGTSDAEVVALDQETGALKWRSRVPSEVLSVPQASESVVVVQSIDGKVTGLDAKTGQRLWLYDRSAPPLTLRGTSTPSISGSSSVICGFDSGRLVALGLGTGTVLWEAVITPPSGRSELERMVDIDTDPLVMGGVVFIGTYQNEVAAVAEDTGIVFWRRKLSAFSSMSADWRHLFVTDSADVVWAIDPRSGAPLWKQDKMPRRRLSGPVVVGDYLVVGDYEGYLHWLSVEDGHFMARSRVGRDPISARLRVDGDTLYALGESGDFAAMQVSGPIH